MGLLTTLGEIEYPQSVDRPTDKGDCHRKWLVRIHDLSSRRYLGQRVYVGSDLFLYYTEGVPQDIVVPDIFVVLDCEPRARETFPIWNEGRVPSVVFDVTSAELRRLREQIARQQPPS